MTTELARPEAGRSPCTARTRHASPTPDPTLPIMSPRLGSDSTYSRECRTCGGRCTCRDCAGGRDARSDSGERYRSEPVIASGRTSAPSYRHRHVAIGLLGL